MAGAIAKQKNILSVILRSLKNKIPVVSQFEKLTAFYSYYITVLIFDVSMFVYRAFGL
jgi:hypothetical protein